MTLIDQIKQILDQNLITQGKLAKEAGIHASALSTYLKGSYTGNNEAVTQALTQWLERREAKKRFVQAPDFIHTATAKQIFDAFEFARILGTMATVYGMSGAGKTRAAQEFKRTNQNVWIVTASPSRATLSAILYEMAMELGLNDAPRQKDKLARLIVKKLSGSQGLMIIDEADHLPYNALEEIRCLQEETGKDGATPVGVVLIGNDKVYSRMRGASHQSHEFARLWSRIAQHVSIQKCKKEDVRLIAEAWGLDSKDPEIMDILNKIGANGGGLRSLTQTLRLAGIYAKGQDSLITKALILNANQALGGNQ